MNTSTRHVLDDEYYRHDKYYYDSDHTDTTIIRIFRLKRWQVLVSIESAQSVAYNTSRLYRLWVCVKFIDELGFEETASLYDSPWVHHDDVVGVPIDGVYEGDPEVVRGMVRDYGRATMGAAVKMARKWQIEHVKRRLKGEFSD